MLGDFLLPAQPARWESLGSNEGIHDVLLRLVRNLHTLSFRWQGKVERRRRKREFGSGAAEAGD